MPADESHIINLAEQVGRATSAIEGLSSRFDEDLEARKEIRKTQDERFETLESKVDDLTGIASKAVIGAKVVRWVVMIGAGAAGAWAAGGEWISKAMSIGGGHPPK